MWYQNTYTNDMVFINNYIINIVHIIHYILFYVINMGTTLKHAKVVT